MLCKNIVVKNLIKESKRLTLPISENHTYTIDAKKYFNANVSAVLFISKFNSVPSFDCDISPFNSEFTESKNKFGWVGNLFVSNIDKYQNYSYLDGNCPFIWRQGVKHDLTNVMVLTKLDKAECNEMNGNIYQNGLEETIELEDLYIYPLLKSSQLKNKITTEVKLNVIIPQKFIGDPTDQIKSDSPKLWSYLTSHLDLFNNRKSKIYQKAPQFAIFGIGPYSFEQYKIGISWFL